MTMIGIYSMGFDIKLKWGHIQKTLKVEVNHLNVNSGLMTEERENHNLACMISKIVMQASKPSQLWL